MNVELDKITYKYVQECDMHRLLDKIDLMNRNKLYKRKRIERHFGDDVKYCVQFHNDIPLSIGINKFNSFSDNDATCVELTSIIPGYSLYLITHLIEDYDINYGKDLWLMVDSSNDIYSRLLKLYSVFQKKYGMKRVIFNNSSREFTFFYSYPCRNEKTELEFFRNVSSNI